MTPANHSTDQAALSQQIARSEKRLRALLTATSDIIYRASPDWSLLYEFDGRGLVSDIKEPSTHWMELNIPPEEFQRVRAAIAAAISGKTIFELEHRVLRPDGTIGWTFSRAVPILDENGEITEWFGTASDVTARKTAEELFEKARLAQDSSKRLYEAVTSNSPDLMYVFNLNYRFIYANTALLAMWGKTYEDSMGRGLLELGYEPWHAEMHEKEIDQVAATKTMVRGEVSFPHATLGRRIYDYIFSPVLDSNGNVIAVAGTTRDISEIKAAEEMLKQNREQLEQLVADRTRELKRSNDDLMQFAHVASHDLKEPLRKFRTFAGLLENEMKDLLTEKAAQYLQKINSATDRMSSMIEGVLSYSKLTHYEQRFVEVDLNQVIHHIKDDLEIIIRQKNATIEYGTLPVVEGASVLLYQLFYNLFNNALKFSKASEAPVITLAATLEGTGDEETWAIRMQDNGIGFSQEYSERIFDTFTRLHAKDEYEGTGLGLALCKKIAERHNGSIHAFSEEGKGSTFQIRLPRNVSKS